MQRQFGLPLAEIRQSIEKVSMNEKIGLIVVMAILITSGIAQPFQIVLFRVITISPRQMM